MDAVETESVSSTESEPESPMLIPTSSNPSSVKTEEVVKEELVDLPVLNPEPETVPCHYTRSPVNSPHLSVSAVQADCWWLPLNFQGTEIRVLIDTGSEVTYYDPICIKF